MTVDFQPLIDFSITAFVLIAMFILVYCAIRKQGIRETWDEIRGISHDKISEVGDVIKYANR